HHAAVFVRIEHTAKHPYYVGCWVLRLLMLTVEVGGQTVCIESLLLLGLAYGSHDQWPNSLESLAGSVGVQARALSERVLDIASVVAKDVAQYPRASGGFAAVQEPLHVVKDRAVVVLGNGLIESLCSFRG